MVRGPSRLAKPVHASWPSPSAVVLLTPLNVPGTIEIRRSRRPPVAWAGGVLVVEPRLGQRGGGRPGRDLREPLGREHHQVEVEAPFGVITRLSRDEAVVHDPDEATVGLEELRPP